MKKKLLFSTSVAIAVAILLNGCSPKLYEKTFDDLTFRTRDTIQLGYSEYGCYFHVAHWGSANVPYTRSCSNLAFNRYVIWNIDEGFSNTLKQELKTSDGIIAVYEKASYSLGVGYTYINVREALNSGEMVLKMNPNASKNPLLTDKIAFLYYTKQRANEAGSLANEYLYRFQKELYGKGSNDEFEREKMLQTSNALLRDEVQKVDFTQQYYIYTTMEFGEYNFAKKGFPIQKEALQSDGSGLIIANSEGQHPPIGLSFSNLKDFQLVSVPEGEASQLIKRVKSRKDVLGNISRKVYAIINFEVSPSKVGERELQGRIVDIELYEFPVKVQGMGYNWIGTMK
ncbi:MAG: DUF4852 domain-containing protein [Prevotellaceae bacterium]|nr:DUF4852 domain-containing protein [Prevotellaceae bacterium]